MANDRVFIKCDSCGAWKTLLKHYPGDLCTTNNEVLDWINSHAICHPNYYSMFLDGNPGFSLHTENELKEGGCLDPNKNSIPPPEY